MTIKKKIRLSNIMMVLIPILFTTIVLIVSLNTSLGSYWHTFIDMYSDENGVQFARSMIYNYQQELWENNWGYCPEMDACQTEIWHSDEMTHLKNKLSGLGYRFMITKNGESIFCITAVHPQETDGTMVNYLKSIILRYLAGILLLFVALTVCINGILSWWISGSILKPLGKLSLGTKEIREGNLDTPMQYEKKDEFGQVCRDFDEMRAYLQESVQQRLKDEKRRRDTGFRYHMEETDFRDYVEKYLELVRPDMENQQVQTEYFCGKGSFLVRLDREEFKRIFNNLFANTVRLQWKGY